MREQPGAREKLYKYVGVVLLMKLEKKPQKKSFIKSLWCPVYGANLKRFGKHIAIRYKTTLK